MRPGEKHLPKIQIFVRVIATRALLRVNSTLGGRRSDWGEDECQEMVVTGFLRERVSKRHRGGLVRKRSDGVTLFRSATEARK